ncbi:bifunctional diaminohydroxyphosphoribosylaminopyrimidine deaminase/5-amino-6-(5-phosphoribosylamino)uracil reductase RibD [Chloroflexota bacterium]
MDHMEEALSLARLALGQASPNPAVGAVVVKDDAVIGQGYTQEPGSWHAEIGALEQAGAGARGGALYVTLEPCCHYGRTPPCTQAIINAGISEVHMAMLDTNPLVFGRGRDELEKAGIKTYVGENEMEARELNEAYIKYITTGLPFITAKFAVSLDGKIATKSGDSKWISGEESRKHVHNMRYAADAIMAGVNTLIADDPQLTIRCSGGKGGTARKQPLRIIVDGKGRTPLTARVFNEPGSTIVVLSRPAKPDEKKAFARVGAEILELPSEGLVSLADLFRTLGEREVTSVLVEGGGKLFGSLFDLGLVDKVVAFIAPIVIGGEEAKMAVGGQGVDKVADALRLERIKVENIDDDVMISGYVPRG